MNKLTKQIYNALKNVDQTDFWDVFGDAHTIFAPSAFTKLGLPESYVNTFVYNYMSDGTPKGTITDNDGNMLDELKGVMSSNVASNIAGKFDLNDAILEAGQKMGRGSSLRIISGAIWKHVRGV
jgi:hypothetical protein